MNKYTAAYILGIISCSLYYACGATSDPEGNRDREPVLSRSEINPNGASELALLMRTMETQTELWKQEVLEEKETLSPVPDVYTTLKTAIPTTTDMKNENYDAFSDDFVTYSRQLEKTVSTQERITRFNTMVGGCMACHDQMCPGPIKRIRKFYF